MTQNEITITAFTRGKGSNWSLWIRGDSIPQTIKGFEKVKMDEIYRIRLKNTKGLDESSPGWFKQWNFENTPVDITSWENNFSMIIDNGKLTLTVKLRDDAVVERWYGEDW